MDKREIGEILKKALGHGADFAEFFLEHKETTSVFCEENRIERINSGIDEGVGIRVIHNNSTSYAYTNDLSLERLLEVAETAGKAAQKEARYPETFNFITPSAEAQFNIRIPPSEIKLETKTSKILEANKAARGVDPRIRQVTVSYGDIKQDIIIANSEGIYVEDARTRTRIAVNAVAAENDVIQTGYFSAGGVTGFELFDDNPASVLGENAARRAVLMLSAQAAPSGKMPVVMDSKAGGTMIHEACGHGLEADLVHKGLSVYAGKKGEQVASPLVTVIDDALIPNKYGSLRYDDEGKPGQKTVLIKNGVLEEFMYDYQTAHKEGRESTGNGRRESYQNRPIPRMRNTYIAPGNTKPHKIMKEVEDGLLVMAMGGGQVNTTNGDYVFDVAEGYLIKDGEIVAPVRGATLTGNGPSTLQAIEMVGSDLGYTIGVCGKDGQGVPVSDAQPTILVKELIVGGRGIDKSNGKIRRI
ncbi:MAG: peptidase C69 [Firmicutes bacterium HGW-Firmicutes-12]|jgi:TldD protein|nr:MAG: peptidase C69 [Firmicutes bacterium HGW-Firmicutes-12]